MPPSKPSPGGRAFLLSAERIRQIEALAARPEVAMDGGQFAYQDAAGRRTYRLRDGIIRPDRGARGHGIRFRVWFDSARSLLMVDEGSVIYRGGPEKILRPVFPTVDGVPVNVRDGEGRGQGFAMGQGTMELVLKYRFLKCCGHGTTVPDSSDASDASAAPAELVLTTSAAQLVLAADEKAVLVATVTVAADEDGILHISSLKQWLGSDWPADCDGCDSSDDSSDSSDDDLSDSSDSSDDSGSSDDSSGSDDSGSGSGSADCCPRFEISALAVMSAAISAPGVTPAENCFPLDPSAPLETGAVTVFVNVRLLDNPCGCQNYYWTCSVGAGQFHAPGSGASPSWVAEVTAWPCQAIPVTVCWRVPVTTNPAQPCHDLTCCLVTNALAPPICGEDCETTAPDSDSSSG